MAFNLAWKLKFDEMIIKLENEKKEFDRKIEFVKNLNDAKIGVLREQFNRRLDENEAERDVLQERIRILDENEAERDVLQERVRVLEEQCINCQAVWKEPWQDRGKRQVSEELLTGANENLEGKLADMKKKRSSSLLL